MKIINTGTNKEYVGEIEKVKKSDIQKLKGNSETYTFKIKKKFFEKIGIKIMKFKIGLP